MTRLNDDNRFIILAPSEEQDYEWRERDEHDECKTAGEPKPNAQKIESAEGVMCRCTYRLEESRR